MMYLIAPGNQIRSLGGCKSECADKGYSAQKDGEKISEVEAISRKCYLECSPVESAGLGQFLGKGGKIISTTEFARTVAVFDNSGREQSGNGYTGKDIEQPKPACNIMAQSGEWAYCRTCRNS